LDVPSLNERREDIPLLANFFAEKIVRAGTIIKKL
jgi:DNA-binding NtrC family response regulator